MSLHAKALPIVRANLAVQGWLATCPADFSDAVLAAGHVRDLKPGEALHHAGDMAGGMCGVVDGQLISSTGIAGPNTSLVAVYLPGEWIGTGPISGFRRQLNLSARTRTTVIAVPQLAVSRLLDARPGWWEHFNRLHFQLMIKFGLLAADLQISDSRARVAAILLNAAGMRLQGEKPVRMAISQNEVGRMANLSHYPTGNILRGFASDGLISIGYGHVIIDRPTQVREVAEGNDR